MKKFFLVIFRKIAGSRVQDTWHAVTWCSFLPSFMSLNFFQTNIDKAPVKSNFEKPPLVRNSRTFTYMYIVKHIFFLFFKFTDFPGFQEPVRVKILLTCYLLQEYIQWRHTCNGLNFTSQDFTTKLHNIFSVQCHWHQKLKRVAAITKNHANFTVTLIMALFGQQNVHKSAGDIRLAKSTSSMHPLMVTYALGHTKCHGTRLSAQV
jgi:hypothetical protein